MTFCWRLLGVHGYLASRQASESALPSRHAHPAPGKARQHHVTNLPPDGDPYHEVQSSVTTSAVAPTAYGSLQHLYILHSSSLISKSSQSCLVEVAFTTRSTSTPTNWSCPINHEPKSHPLRRALVVGRRNLARCPRHHHATVHDAVRGLPDPPKAGSPCVSQSIPHLGYPLAIVWKCTSPHCPRFGSATLTTDLFSGDVNWGVLPTYAVYTALEVYLIAAARAVYQRRWHARVLGTGVNILALALGAAGTYWVVGFHPIVHYDYDTQTLYQISWYMWVPLVGR